MVSPQSASGWTGHRAPRNRLLESLSVDDWAGVEPLLERVQLTVSQVLEPSGEASPWLHFPESAVIAMVTTFADGRRVEVGTVGNDGMCGMSAWLEAAHDGSQSLCHIAGAALRGRAVDIIAVAARRPTIHRLLSRYASAYLGLVEQGTACNRIHPLERRCARWLLMTRDRLPSAHLLLTLDMLAIMLGVPHGGATIAIQALRRHGLIRASRDRIDIMDRPGLERMSCECYQVVRHQFARIA